MEMTDGGLDYTFECIGNIHTMVGEVLTPDANHSDTVVCVCVCVCV